MRSRATSPSCTIESSGIPKRANTGCASSLSSGRREFGGYDVILLWHAYPRIGIDPRNQLDFYRDMPGGLPGLRRLVKEAHELGTKVFINYNPWDTGTRREPVRDEEFLADLVAATDLDGIFLDTMTGDSPTLAAALERVRPGTSLCPEIHPALGSLAWCNGSWSQGLDPGFGPAAIDHRRWIEPRHMRWHIDRWNRDHTEEIRRTFFNGSGMLVWENVFGAYNPWRIEDRLLWRRASAILRQFSKVLAQGEWEPFVTVNAGSSASQEGPFCNRWSAPGVELYSFLFPRGQTHGQSECFLPNRTGASYYDVWNGTRLLPVVARDSALVKVGIDPANGLGCLAVIEKNRDDRSFRRFLAAQRATSQAVAKAPDLHATPGSMLGPRPVGLTPTGSSEKLPPGMALVPGGTVRMELEHTRRECGCYPDPGTAPEKAAEFLWGNPFHETLRHHYEANVSPFLIDEAEVSNAEFKAFLDATRYRPKHRENFLKHWPGGAMPAAIADHPVVYVDLDDARAFARWAGKRLPTESEWHLAAQGTDGRTWPWGGAMDRSKPDSRRVNTTGATLPIRSLPEGRSPYGCYHMSGNVYEWTESERDDRHTRFAIIRGGSFFQAQGSIWYADGGPRPCTHHAKFILMWPGLDRCSTIGFRCVKDL